MKTYFSILIISFALAFFYVLPGCKKDKTDYACNSETPVLRKAVNETGIFSLDKETGRYVIIYSKPNTYDSQDIFLICNPPASLPNETAEVTFSGDVRASTKKSEIGGTTYYELNIESLK